MALLAQKVVFCEGGPEGTDVLLVRRAVSSPSALVRPIGSKWGMSSFVRGSMAEGAPRPHLVIRDPDFDHPPPDAPPPYLRRVEEAPPTYVWGRNEIENYLLHPHLLLPVYDALRSRWRPDLALPAADTAYIQAGLVAAARAIVHYQVARWTLAGLRPRDDPPILRTDWLGEWQLPPAMDEDAMRDALSKQVERFASRSASVNSGHARRLFDEHAARFTSQWFWDQSAFIAWFSGKDMLVAWLRGLGVPERMADSVASHAAQELLLRPDEDLPPDFHELRSLAQAL